MNILYAFLLGYLHLVFMGSDNSLGTPIPWEFLARTWNT